MMPLNTALSVGGATNMDSTLQVDLGTTLSSIGCCKNNDIIIVIKR